MTPLKAQVGTGASRQVRIRSLKSDLAAETGAVQSYNEAIHLADEVGDATTKALLEEILHDEDDHVDWLEEQLDQIAQMGAGIYLSTQTRN